MNTRLLMLLLMLLIGCTSHQLDLENKSKIANLPERNKVHQEEIIEYFDWHKVKINNLLPLQSKEQKVLSLFKRADSIISPDIQGVCVSFNDRDFKYAYYQNIQFEKYNDTLVFRSIDFRNNKKNFLQINDLILNASTTLEQLKNHFPKSVEAVYPIVYSNKDEELEAIQLEVTNPISDDKWILLFKKKKLINIEFWLPC